MTCGACLMEYYPEFGNKQNKNDCQKQPLQEEKGEK